MEKSEIWFMACVPGLKQLRIADLLGLMAMLAAVKESRSSDSVLWSFGMTIFWTFSDRAAGRFSDVGGVSRRGNPWRHQSETRNAL